MTDNLVVPTDGMEITEDTKLAPGVYDLPNGLTIAADGVTLDGSGVLLIGQDHTSAGVRVEGKRNVQIQGLSISGYYHGIRADDCKDMSISDVRIRDTAEIEGIDTFLYLWKPIEEAYSAAILLHRVEGGLIRDCDLQHQMNGLLLYGCSGLYVENNNASFNSGWGVYLSASNDIVIQDNRLDFCNRVYRRPEDGSIRVEADAAGIVLVYSSSHNRFLRNSCLSGGDGIFVAGYDHLGNQGSCNENVFEDNDCRFSSNNAIESTFSRGNVFRRNNCSRSNYGFWMGYSWENILEDNIIEHNHMVGVAVEHGYDFTLRNNQIRHNGEGVRLWTRGGPVVQHWPGHEVSYNFTLEDNQIESNDIGVHGYTGNDVTDQDCHDFHLRRNVIRENRDGVRFSRVKDCTLIAGNQFVANVAAAVRLVGGPGVQLEKNDFEDNAEDILEV